MTERRLFRLLSALIALVALVLLTQFSDENWVSDTFDVQPVQAQDQCDIDGDGIADDLCTTNEVACDWNSDGNQDRCYEGVCNYFDPFSDNYTCYQLKELATPPPTNTPPPPPPPTSTFTPPPPTLTPTTSSGPGPTSVPPTEEVTEEAPDPTIPPELVERCPEYLFDDDTVDEITEPIWDGIIKIDDDDPSQDPCLALIAAIQGLKDPIDGLEIVDQCELASMKYMYADTFIAVLRGLGLTDLARTIENNIGVAPEICDNVHLITQGNFSFLAYGPRSKEIIQLKIVYCRMEIGFRELERTTSWFMRNDIDITILTCGEINGLIDDPEPTETEAPTEFVTETTVSKSATPTSPLTSTPSENSGDNGGDNGRVSFDRVTGAYVVRFSGEENEGQDMLYVMHQAEPHSMGNLQGQIKRYPSIGPEGPDGLHNLAYFVEEGDQYNLIHVEGIETILDQNDDRDNVEAQPLTYGLRDADSNNPISVALFPITWLDSHRLLFTGRVSGEESTNIYLLDIDQANRALRNGDFPTAELTVTNAYSPSYEDRLKLLVFTSDVPLDEEDSESPNVLAVRLFINRDSDSADLINEPITIEPGKRNYKIVNAKLLLGENAVQACYSPRAANYHYLMICERNDNDKIEKYPYRIPGSTLPNVNVSALAGEITNLYPLEGGLYITFEDGNSIYLLRFDYKTSTPVKIHPSEFLERDKAWRDFIIKDLSWTDISVTQEN
jgi:hypothetical protein